MLDIHIVSVFLETDGGGDGWQQLMAPVGGKVKTSEFFLVPNELKSTQNNMVFLFFFHIWGVGGSEANVDKSTFFLNPSLNSNC